MTKYPFACSVRSRDATPRACWWRHGRWRGERAVSRLCWMASRTGQARQHGFSLRPVAPAAGRRRLDRGHARTRNRPTVRTEAVKGELDGGISSAAGGQFRLFETGPDVMSREAAERQARTGRPVRGVPDARGPVRLSHGCWPSAGPPCASRASGRSWAAGRAGRRSGVDSTGLDATQARLPPGRHAGDPAHPAAARPDRGAPRAGRRRAGPSTGPAEGHRKSCQQGFPGSPRQRRPASHR